MAIDFVANQQESWLSATGGTSATGVDTTRIVGGGISVAQTGTPCESPTLPSRTSGAITFLTFSNGGGINNASTPFSWSNSVGTPVLRIQVINGSRAIQLQYWNGSAWVGVGSGVAIPIVGALLRFELAYSGLGTSSGALNLIAYNLDSGLVLGTWAATGLNLTSVTNISKCFIGANVYSSGLAVVYDYVATDQTDVEGIQTYYRVPTGNGSDVTGATGGFGNIDENGINDSDLVSLSADGSRYSFTCPARAFDSKKVKGIVINYRARRGATGSTSVRPYLLIGGIRYYAATQALTTTYISGYKAMWEVNPATGTDWVTADAEAASLTFGFEATT